MLAIEIEFLTGRFSASSHDDRAKPEWPPHPARVFSALVATWADADVPSAEERAVIMAIEKLGDPEIVASACSHRSVVTHFVPINDTAVVRTHTDRMERVGAAVAALGRDPDPKSAARLTKQLAKDRAVEAFVAGDGKGNPVSARELFPEHRPKQARLFPSVTPDSPVVVYRWPNADFSVQALEVLDGLLARVSRIGHSSSLVACRITESGDQATFVPDGAGAAVIRSVRSGQLDALERAHSRHKGSGPRTLPATGVRYAPTVTQRPAQDVLDPTTAGVWQIIEFEPGHRGRPMTASVAIAAAVRGAVLSHAAEPHPELLSGHETGGRRSAAPHVAFVPLPFVGRQHATGSVMGVAVCLPSSVTRDDPARMAVFGALAAWERAADDARLEIRLGRAGVIRGHLVDEPSVRALRRNIWARPSRRWCSVTPLALSQHPGSLRKGSPAKLAEAWRRAEAQVARECAHVGLPTPATVAVDLAPMVIGSAAAAAYPAFVQQDHRSGRDAARALVHVEVVFDQPVRGPLLLGAGRFVGLGLMRPMEEGDDEQ